MYVQLERKHLFILVLLAVLLVGFGAGLGWVFSPSLPGSGSVAEADYYRGIFDLCRFMVVSSGKHIDCNKMAATADKYDWYEEESRGFEWPPQ